MTNYDDILTTPFEQSGQPENHSVDRDAWITKQNQHRETAYELIDTALKEVRTDGGKLQLYLQKQSQFDRYSVRNALLIMKQRPDALKLGDKAYWKGQGFFIRKQERDKPVLILEPGKAFVREDGSIGQYYNIKEVYDIAQTTIKLKESPTIARDHRLLLQALIYKRPAEIKTIGDLQDKAVYQPDTNEIFVRAGMEPADIFRAVSKELAHAEFAAKNEHYSYSEADFKAKCVSYMLCKKNGIDGSGYDIKNLPDMEASEVLEVLSSIRETANHISARMAKVFEQNKQPKQQAQER